MSDQGLHYGGSGQALTGLVSSGPNWPYSLVQLNGDTCHVPLPREGHLSVLPVGGTNSATCRRVSQLEVCQLLSSVLQVIYPVGLNGCEAPMIASLPESPARGTNLLGGEPIYLKVDIPLSTVGKSELKVPPSGVCSSILMVSPIKATLPKVESEGAPIPGGVRHIWTCVRELNTKEAKSCGHTHASALQMGRSFWSSGHIIPGEHPR